MKQQVWILNSSLLVLFFMSQLLLFMLQKAVPRRISISPGVAVIEPAKVTPSIDIATVYQQDLFGTYEPPVIVNTSVIDDIVSPIPKPPKAIAPDVPIEKAPTFFAPLDAVLKGVIFVKDDPASSIAILQVKKTKEEKNYQVGDLVEDAQIIKIMANRIIIIRSNGQQETLYLREEDAVQDFNSDAHSSAKGFIESASGNKYTVNIDEFVKKIHNLGEFINALDLTTVYKQGKSYGCRVGKIEKDSLGTALGFVANDIIVKVDSILVDDLASRIKLYDLIMNKKVGDVINVEVQRGDDAILLMYGLIDKNSKEIVFTQQETHEKLLEQLEAKKNNTQIDENTQVVVQRMHNDDDEFSENDWDDNTQDICQDESQDDMTFNNDAPEDIPVEKKTSFVSEIVSLKKTTPQAASMLDEKTINQLDGHKQRLLQEREKLTPTLQGMKFQDRKNMLKQRSRNVIFNGMEQ